MVATDLTIDQTTISGATLTVNSGVTLTVNDGTGTDLTNSGTLVNSGTLTNSGSISVTGTYSHAGTITGNALSYSGSSSTLIYSGSAEQTTTAYEFSTTNGPANLTISNVEGVILDFSRELSGDLTVSSGEFNVGDYTLTVNGDIDIDGTLTISTGIVDANGTFDATDRAIDFTGAGNLKLGGATVTSLGTLDSEMGTVWYDSASSQSIVSGTYYNLTLSGESIKTLAADITVENELTVAEDTTLSLDTHTLTLGSLNSGTGVWNNSGIFDAGTGTFIYGDDTEQTILSLDYYKLGVENGDKVFADGTTTVEREITVTDSLSLSGSSVNNVIIEADSSRAFNVLSGELILDNIKIMKYDSGIINGGAFYIETGAEVVLNNMYVAGVADTGGSAFFNLGTVTAINSTIRGNSCDYGIIDNFGVFNLTNSTVFGEGGYSNYASAIWNSGTFIGNNSTITHTGTAGYGYSVYNCYSGVATLINTTVTENYCNGIFNDSGSVFYMGNSAVVNNDGVQICNEGEFYSYYSWYDSVQGEITTEESAPNQLTLYSSGDFGEISYNGGLTRTVPVMNENVPSVSNGTYFYNIDGTLDGYYLLAEDGLYHQLTDYNTTLVSEPSGKISVDQRSFPRTGTATIGSYQYLSNVKFRTASEGMLEWMDIDSWEFSLDDGESWSAADYYPQYYNAGSIAIRSGADMHITDSSAPLWPHLTIDQVTVEDGGELTVDEGGVVIVSDGPGNDISVEGSGVLDIDIDGWLNASEAQIAFSDTGEFLISSGTVGVGGFSAGSSTVIFEGADQEVFDADYYNLNLTGGGAKTYSSISAEVLSVAEGVTFDGSNLTVNSSLNNSGIIQSSGSVVLPSDIDVGGTFVYDRSSSQSIAEVSSYNNLTLSGTGWKTSSSGLTANVLTVNSGVTLNANSVLTVNNSLLSTGSIYCADSVSLPSDTEVGGTFSYDGSNQTIAEVTSYNRLTLEGTGIKTAVSDLTVGTLVVNNGISLNADAVLSVGNTLTNTGTIYCSDTAVLPSEAEIGGTFVYDGSNQTITGVSSYNNLSLSGNGIKILGANIDVNGNLSIREDTIFDVSESNYQINIAGNWNNSGTFTHRTGTVIFDGEGISVISGETDFYNFTCITAGKTLTFATGEGNLQTIEGTFTLTGSCGNNIILNSDEEGTQAEISVTNYSVSYVTVQDSNNISGIDIEPEYSLDFGNNSGWVFPAAYYYRTNAVGNWNWSEAANWQISEDGESNWITANESPDFENSFGITVRNGTDDDLSATILHIDNDLSIDQTIVESGVSLIVDSGTELFLVDESGADLTAVGTAVITVNGTFNGGEAEFVFTGNGTFNINGTVTGLDNFNPGISTVLYSSLSSQSIVTGTYYNLTLSGESIKTLAADITVENDLTVAEDTTLSLDTHNLTLGTANSGTGVWNNSGIFDAGTGTFIYGDDTDQTILSLDYYKLGVENGDKVFADGTTTVEREITVTDSLSLSGSSVNNVIIEADSSRAFNVLSGELILDNIKIMKYDSGIINGGAFYIETGAEVVLNNMYVAGVADTGGSAFFNLGTVTAINSTIRGNSCDYGIIDNFGVFNLTNSTVFGEGGYSNYASAIWNSGTFIGNNSTITHTGTAGYGYSVYNCYSGVATLINTTVTENYCNGIFNDSGSVFYMGNSAVVNNDGVQICNEGEFYSYYSWYDSVQGEITTEESAPNQLTLYSSGDFGEISYNGGLTRTVPVMNENVPSVSNGTYFYNIDGTLDGYYLLAEDGLYHQLTDYNTTLVSEPSGKISVDQRSFPRTGTATIGSYQYLSNVKFRTASEGMLEWMDIDSWEFSLDDGESWSAADYYPQYYNAGSIAIRSGADMHITDSSAPLWPHLTIDQVTVEDGGELTVDEGGVVIVSDGPGNDISVEGSGVLDIDIDGWLNASEAQIAFSDTGEFLISSGTVGVGGFSAGSSTVIFEGADQEVFDADYYNLNLTGGGAKTYSSISAEVLSVAEGVTFDGSNLTVNSSLNNSGIIQSSGSVVLPSDIDVGGTFVYDRSSSQNIAEAASYNSLVLSGGSWKSASSDLTANSLTVNSGTSLDVNAALTVNNSLSGTGNIYCAGSVILPVDAEVGGIFVYDGNDQTIAEVISYNTLTLSGSGMKTLGGNLGVNGSLSIGANTTLDVSESDFQINVAGNWTNNGTFNANSGTVTFDGSGTSVISGETTFNNFTCTTAGKTLTFVTGSGNLQTVEGTFTLTGSDGNNIVVNSDEEGTQAEISVTNYSVSYVTVQDSNNSSGTDIQAYNSTNSGNNTGWYFADLSYYYRTNAIGTWNWSTAANWQISEDGETGWTTAVESPDYNNSCSITIREGAEVLINSDLTIDQTYIESGAALNVYALCTLTVNDGIGTDLTSNGSFTVYGSLSVSSGTVGINSTFNVYQLLEYTSDGKLYLSNSEIYINSFIAGDSTVIYDGADQEVFSADYNILRIAGSGTKTVSGNISSDTLFVENVVFDVNGSLTVNNTFSNTGTVKAAASVNIPNVEVGGTFIYDQGAGEQTIVDTVSYNNLRISGSGTKNSNSSINVLNTLTVDDSSQLVVAGDINVLQNIENSGTINIDGNISLPNVEVGGTIRFIGEVSQTLPEVISYNTLEFWDESSNVTSFSYLVVNSLYFTGTLDVGCGLTVNENLSNSGTINILNGSALTAAGVLSNNGVITATGSVTIPNVSAGNFIYNCTGDQTIAEASYESLTILGAGTKTSSGITASNLYIGSGDDEITVDTDNLSVGDRIELLEEYEFTLSENSTIRISGDFYSSCTSFNQLGTLVFDGNNQSIETINNFTTVNITGTGTKTSTEDSSFTATILNVEESITLNVQGNFTVSDTLSNSGTIRVSGNVNLPDNIDVDGTFIYASTASLSSIENVNSYYNLINESQNTVYAESINVLNNFDVQSGLLYASDISVGNSITNNGHIAITGELNVSESSEIGGTFQYQGENQAIAKVSSYNNLIIGRSMGISSGIKTLAGNLDVNGNLTIMNSNTIDVSENNYEITVAGSWTNNGTFNANSGTVIFDGAGTSIISGETNFYNFTCVTAGKTLTFATGEGNLQSVEGTFTLTGAFSSNIIINSDEEGTQAEISVTNYSVSYVTVQDSNNSSGTDIQAYNSTNSGNNTGWYFADLSYYYRTNAIGIWNWSVASNWQISEDGDTGWITATESPDYDNSLGITVRNGTDANTSATNVVVATDLTIDQTTISGATLTVNSGVTLTVNDGTGTDLTNSGTLVNSGTLTNSGSISVTGTYSHAGTITGNDLSYSGSSSTLIYSGLSQQTTTDIEFSTTNGPANLTVSNVEGVILDFSRELSGDLTVSAGELSIGDNILTVIGNADIDGTLSISRGTVDVDGTFDATGGAIDFSNYGYLNLGGTVTCLGSLSTDNGQVCYDSSGEQTVLSDSYYTLKISGGNESTKTLAGEITVKSLTIDNDTTLDISENNYGINIRGYWGNYGTFIERTGTVSFNFDNQSGIGGIVGDSLTELYNLTVINESVHSASFGFNGNITILNSFITPDNCTVSLGSGTINLEGTWTRNNADVGCGTSTFIYSGADKTILSFTYYNLIVSGTGTKILEDALSVEQNLTISENATLDITENNYGIAIGGNWSNSGEFNEHEGTVEFNNLQYESEISSETFYNLTTGCLAVLNGDTVIENILTTNCDFNISSVTLTIGSSNAGNGEWYNCGQITTANGVVIYADNHDQTIMTDYVIYNDLILSNGATKILDGSISINGNLTISEDTVFDITGSNYQITLGGNWINNSGTFEERTGTVLLNGGSQSVSAETFYNLSISETGIRTLAGTVTVENILSTAENSTLVLGDNILNIGSSNAGTGVWNNSGSFRAGTGTVNYAEEGEQTIVAETYYNLILSGSGTKALAGSTTVLNDFNITGTEKSLNVSDYTINISGNADVDGEHTIYIESGTFDVDGIFLGYECTVDFYTGEGKTEGNIKFGGSYIVLGAVDSETGIVWYDREGDQNLSSYTNNYNSLKLSGSGTKELGNAYQGNSLTVNNRLTVESEVQFEIDKELIVETDIICEGTVILGSRYGNELPDDFDVNGTFIYNYSGAGQEVLSGSYLNLIISGSGEKRARSSITVNNELTVNEGCSFEVNHQLRVLENIINNGEIISTGSTILPNVTVGGIFTYEKDYSQNIAEVISYENLNLTGSGAKVSNYALNVIETLNIEASVILDLNESLIVGNDFNNAGTVYVSNNIDIPIGTEVGGTFVYDGEQQQTIASVISYTNLQLNNSEGAVIESDITVQGELTLANGLLTLGNNDIIINKDGVIKGATGDTSKNDFSAANMIVTSGTGRLILGVEADGNYLFPIGTNSSAPEFTPVNLTFTSGEFGTGAYVGVNVVDSKFQGITEATNYLERYWDVDSSGISDFSSTVRCYYVPEDIVGNEAAIDGSEYNNEVWSNLGPVNSVTHSFAGIINSFSVLTGTDNIDTYYYRTIDNASGNWSNADLWEISIDNETWKQAMDSPDGYNDVVTIRSGSNIASSGSLVLETMTVQASAVMDFNANIEISENFSSQGTVYAAGMVSLPNVEVGGTFNYDGSEAQEIEAVLSYSKMGLNNSEGGVLSGNINITDKLSLTDGLLTLGDYDLTVYAGGAIIGTGNSSSKDDFSSSNMIVISGTGDLIRGIEADGNYLYPIGTNSVTPEYSPVNLEFVSGTYDSGAYVSANTVNSKFIANQSLTNYLNRYWDINSSGISDFSATVTCYYLSGDVVGTESDIKGASYKSGSWTDLNNVNSELHCFNGTVSSFSTFTGVDAVNYTYYRTVENAAGNWSNANLWEVSSDNENWQSAETAPDGNDDIIILRTNSRIISQNALSLEIITVQDGAVFDTDGNLSISHIFTNDGTTNASAEVNLSLDNPEISGTFSYDGKSQEIAELNSYSSLILSGSGTKSSSSDITVLSELTVASGITLDVDGALSVVGSFNNEGTVYAAGAVELPENSVIVGDFIYNGAENQIIANVVSYNNLTLSGNSTKVSSSALNVLNNLTVFEDTTLDSDSDLTVSGTFSNSGKLKIAGSLTIPVADVGGAVYYDGDSAQSIAEATSYNKLYISGNGSKTADFDLYAATLYVGNSTLDVNGNLDVSDSFTLSIDGELYLSGNSNLPFIFRDAWGTFIMDGEDQSINGGMGYWNITLTGSGTKTANSNVEADNFIVDGVNFTTGRLLNVTSQITNTGTISTSAAVILPSDSEIGGIFEYNGANQNIAGANYTNLVLSGSGTKTSTSDLTVSSALTINQDIVLDVNSSISVNRNIYNSGTVNASGTVELSDSAVVGGLFVYDGDDQTIAEAASYNNLTLSGEILSTKTSSANLNIIDTLSILPSITLDVNSDITVNGIISNSGTIKAEASVNLPENSRVQGTFTYDGEADQVIAKAAYYKNLVVGYLFGGKTASASFDLNAGNLTVGMNDSICITGNLTVAQSVIDSTDSFIYVSGDVSLPAGIQLNNGTFVYNGNDQTVDGSTSYYNLILSGSGAKTANEDLNVLSDLTVTGTVLNADESVTVTGNFTNSGTVNVDATLITSESFVNTGTVNVDGTLSVSELFSNTGSIYAGGTVVLPVELEIGGYFIYDGVDQDIVEVESYSNLQISGNGTKSSAVDLVISNELIVDENSTLNVHDDLRISQTITNNGTVYVANYAVLPSDADVGGNFIYYGSASYIAQVESFNNLTISGNPTGVRTRTARGDLTINGTLTLGTGIITLNVRGDLTANRINMLDYAELNVSSNLVVDNLYMSMADESSLMVDSNLTVLNSISTDENSTILVAGADTILPADAVLNGLFIYNGSSAQNIAEVASYDNLNLLDVGVKTASFDLFVSSQIYLYANTDINGSISGAIRAPYASTINISGDSQLTQVGDCNATFIFDGANQSISNINYKNIILSGNGIKSADSDLTAETLTVNENINLTVNSFTVSESVNNNGSIYASGIISLPSDAEIGGSFIYDGYNQNISEVLSYNNLGISGSGNKTALDSLTSNSLTVYRNSTLSVESDLSVILSITNSGTIYASESVSLPSDSQVGGSFIYNGSDQSVEGVTLYNNLVLSGTGRKTADTELAVNDLSVSENVILDVNAALSVSNSIINNGSIYAADSVTLPADSEVGGTFLYNGENQNIASAEYETLFLAGAGTTKVLAGDISVSKQFTIYKNVNFSIETYELSIQNNWTNKGTVDVSHGTVNYSGSDQNIAVLDYYNLLLTGSGKKTLMTDLGSFDNRINNLMIPADSLPNVTLDSNGHDIHTNNIELGSHSILRDSSEKYSTDIYVYNEDSTANIGGIIGTLGNEIKSLTVYGAVNLGAAEIRTISNQQFNGTVILNGDTNLIANQGDSASTVDFAENVDGAFNLTIGESLDDSEKTDVVFNDEVGKTTPLKGLYIYGDAIVYADITTNGTQAYYGSLKLMNPVSFSTTGHEALTPEELDTDSDEIYFIDYNIDNKDMIIDEIPEDALVVQLNSNDSISDLTHVLRQCASIEAVHIISEGNSSQIMIGDTVITSNNINSFENIFTEWDSYLASNADILFYGCNIAENAGGQSVIDDIAQWTGADVAASTDYTGGVDGDWELEYSTGIINTTVLSVPGYPEHLDDYSENDDTDDDSGSIIFNGEIINADNLESVDTGSGSVEYTGAYQTILGLEYSSLAMTGSGTTKTFASGVTVTDTFTLESGVTLTGEPLTYGTSATLKYIGSEVITTSNFEFPGSESGRVVPTNLIIANTGGVTLHADRVLSGALTIDEGGVLNLTTDNQGHNYKLTVTGTTTMESGSILNVADANWSSGALTANGGTVNYSGTSQDILGGQKFHYYNLELSGSGTKKLTADTIVQNNLINGNGITLDSSDKDLGIGGGWTNSGTFITGTGTVNYNGSSDQNIADIAYTNLTVSGSGSKTSSSALSVSSTLTVAESVTLDADGTLIVSGTLTNNGTVKAASTVTIPNVAVSGTFVYDGSDQNIVRAPSYNNLTISGSGTKTADAALTVTDTLTVSDDSVLDVNSSFSLNGTLDNSGTIEASSTVSLPADTAVDGTFIYDGVDQAIAETQSYNNLTVSGSGTKTVAANKTITVLGDFILDSNFYVGAVATLNLNGTVIDSSGTFSAGSNSLVSYGGTDQTVIDGTYYNISFSGSGTKTLGGNITVNNNFTLNDLDVTVSVGSKTLTVSGDMNITSGNLTVGNEGTVKLGGTENSLGTLTAGIGSTVEYNGTVSQRVLAETYHNLILDNGETNAKILSGAVAVNGDLTITSDAKLDVSSNNYAVVVKGDFTNSGTFTARAGTVTLSGTSEQQIKSNDSIFYGLTLNNATGAVLKDALTVDNKLTLSAGLLTLGAYRLTLNTDATIGGTPSSSNMIVTNSTGTVRKKYSGNGSFLFPVGTNSLSAQYSPVTVQFNSGISSEKYVDVRVVNSKEPNNTSTTNYLDRYWVAETNASGFSANVTCYYVPGDVVGTESQIYFAKYSGGAWTRYSAANITNHTISGSGLTSFCDITGINQYSTEESPMNDGTQTHTRTSWRDAIDDGQETGDFAMDVFEPDNDTDNDLILGNYGLNMSQIKLMVNGASEISQDAGEFGLSLGHSAANGEYGVKGHNKTDIKLEKNGLLTIKNGESGAGDFEAVPIKGKTNISDNTDYSYLDFNIAELPDKHPIFKSDLDLILESFLAS